MSIAPRRSFRPSLESLTERITPTTLTYLYFGSSSVSQCAYTIVVSYDDPTFLPQFYQGYVCPDSTTAPTLSTGTTTTDPMTTTAPSTVV